MALTPEQKQKLENLELMKEGVSFALKARAEETQTPTLVISLGGLGGTTLNELKRKVSHGLKQNGHVRFLAIDTDEEKDLAHIKKPVGNLDNGETMSIYSPSSATVLEHGVETAPAEMRKWLNPTFPNTVLSNDGAKGVRQIGRVMLANGETNSRVRNTLTAILTDMGIGTDSDSLNVILIAGISGGTGSGTIIDFTYILHDVLINTIRIPTGAYKIAAYLYTPDVQFSTKGIAGLEAIIQNLKKNGYAAFKEVDYFYNLNKHKASYKLDGYESTKDLFSTCTVVSASQGGGVGMRNQHDVIEALSELLLDQLTDVSYKDDNDSNVQMADSFMSNHDENVKAWYGTTFGAKTNFPKAAFFAYNTVGYASVHIPKDEILAYVAFKMFEAVNREWRNLENVDAEAVTDAMQNTGGTTLDSMVQYAKTVVLAGIEGHPEMEVQIPEGFIPESRFLRGTDCSTVILDAEDVGNEIIEKLKAIKFKEKLKSEIVRNIRSKVNDYFDENGPFATVDLLTHQIGDVPADKDNRNPFSGILQILALQSEAAKTQHNLSKLVKDDQTYLKDLENKRVRAESAVVDKKKYIMDYVETVEKYVQEYTVDAALYQIIGDVLDEARAELVDDNNKIWEVYTSVLREIGRIFKENNDIATEMKVHTTTTGKTFSYSVINLYEDNAKKDALQKYLDGFITPATTAEMCNDFVKSMRDHREAWTEMNVGGNFNAQEEVQRLFDDFFENKIGNDLIERFIVAAYQPNGGVSPAELDVIWDAGGSAKDAAISAAVREIVSELKKRAQNLGKVIDGNNYNLEDFSNKKYLAIPKETEADMKPFFQKELVNQKISDGVQLVTGEGMCKFSLSRLYIGIPLYVIDGFKDYDKAYRTAVLNNTVGMHMDENEQDWRKMPSPYIIDRVAMDGTAYEDYEDYKELEDIQKLVDEAIGYGMIQKDGQNQYYNMTILNAQVSQPNEVDISSKVTAYVDENEYTLTGAFEAVGFRTKKIPLTMDYVALDQASLNVPDPANRYVPIGDLYKLVRKSAYYSEELEKNLKIWRQVKASFDAEAEQLEKGRRYGKIIMVFLNSIKTGIIVRHEQEPVMLFTAGGKNDTLVDLRAALKEDKKYNLYHALVAFSKMDYDRIQQIGALAQNKIQKNETVDVEPFKAEIENILNQEDGLYQFDAFNILKENLEGTQLDYGYTKNPKVNDNPLKVLRVFYEYLKREL